MPVCSAVFRSCIRFLVPCIGDSLACGIFGNECEQKVSYGFRGFHRNVVKDSGHLGSGAGLLGEWFPVFWRSVLCFSARVQGPWRMISSTSKVLFWYNHTRLKHLSTVFCECNWPPLPYSIFSKIFVQTCLTLCAIIKRPCISHMLT